MASGALPPALPMVKIGTDYFWDGGIVSNTPLQHLLDQDDNLNTLVFQVDLFSARGVLPRDIQDVLARQKDIMYSSRTRHITDVYQAACTSGRRDSTRRWSRCPEDQLTRRGARDARTSWRDLPEITILQMIYQQKTYEGDAKDYEFSGTSMREHWQSGYEDTKAHPQAQGMAGDAAARLGHFRARRPSREVDRCRELAWSCSAAAWIAWSELCPATDVEESSASCLAWSGPSASMTMAPPKRCRSTSRSTHRHDGWLWLHLNLADLRAARLGAVRQISPPAAYRIAAVARHPPAAPCRPKASSTASSPISVQGIEGCGEDIGHLRFVMTDRLLISGRRQALSSVQSRA